MWTSIVRSGSIDSSSWEIAGIADSSPARRNDRAAGSSVSLRPGPEMATSSPTSARRAQSVAAPSSWSTTSRVSSSRSGSKARGVKVRIGARSPVASSNWLPVHVGNSIPSAPRGGQQETNTRCRRFDRESGEFLSPEHDAQHALAERCLRAHLDTAERRRFPRRMRWSWEAASSEVTDLHAGIRGPGVPRIGTWSTMSLQPVKPASLCDPSHNGFDADWPQRQSVTRLRVSSTVPSARVTSMPPVTQSGPSGMAATSTRKVWLDRLVVDGVAQRPGGTPLDHRHRLGSDPAVARSWRPSSTRW